MGKRRQQRNSEESSGRDLRSTRSSQQAAADIWLPALRVIICGHSTFRQSEEYVEAVLRAFNGSEDDRGYLASGDDLDVDARWFPACPAHRPEHHLAGALHTLVIILANARLATDDEYRVWLEDSLDLVRMSKGRHRVLVLAETEVTVESFTARRSRLTQAQFLPCHVLSEQAVRPAHFGLIVLNEASRLVLRHIERRGTAKSRLFISHAKKDGLPLAIAILNQLDELPHINTFYDVRSLSLSDDWNRELQEGVAASVVIVIRTAEYDNRPYCVKELRWADKFACPVVVVDASNRLSRPRSDLPLTDVVTVVMRDGNLLRVIYAALREGLRAALLSRTVQQLQQKNVIRQPFAVLHRAPTAASIRHACELNRNSDVSSEQGDRNLLLIYPEPVLPDSELESFTALANYYRDGTQLLTLNQLMASKGL
ncbi:MAG: toll/interleukin-1 receptor domain-containing protein [Fuerstiella sp.]